MAERALTPAQRAVLEVIAEQPGRWGTWSTYTLAHAAATRAQTTQRTLDALRVRGLVGLVDDPISLGRVWEITPAGVDALREPVHG